MSLSFDTLSDWLVSLGVSFPINLDGQEAPAQGPYIPDEPDQLVTVTMLGGTGYELDGSADSPTFQIRVRSPQNDQTTAETLANQLDTAILHAHFPVVINGTKMQVANRLGGAPAPLGPPDDAFRYDYVSTYRVLIGV